jgi:hypothetical protein
MSYRRMLVIVFEWFTLRVGKLLRKKYVHVFNKTKLALGTMKTRKKCTGK